LITVAATVHGKAGKGSTTDGGARDPAAALPAMGKRTLVEAVPTPVPGSTGVQHTGEAAAPLEGEAAAQIARHGTEGAGGPLPHLDRIQSLFGRHDVTGVTTHQGPEASQAAQSLGARAYAHENAVAFASSPDLHTAAHEAAHVVQQRKGVQLRAGIDEPGDSYERHADAVAVAVVAGRSAEPLLDQLAAGGQHEAAVQRSPAAIGATTGPVVTPPAAGIDKTGFIDRKDGANLHTDPIRSADTLVRDEPLPPAARVFVSGTHPHGAGWWYVTAFLPHTMVRGYVQGFRVNTRLPEPLAELHLVEDGETAEGLAKKQFSTAVSDGHDLRYYENVLLYTNQDRQPPGVRGTYQDPGLLGGGSNNVQLIAGELIWLVSVPYAKSLQSIVPSGSLTGGAIAKARRFADHIEDILRSVTESRHHFREVAGEYAQAIRDHLPEIAGIVAAFLMAEATSAFLAATPTGVGQIAAVVIQLALAAFGAAGMTQAGAEAVKHASAWLTTAWTASGKDDRIAAASIEFLKMLVSVAIAALSYVGVKGNFGNAVKIASSMPTGGLPAFAIAGGGQLGSRAGAGTGVLIGPSTGSLGTAGNAMMQADDRTGGGGDEGEKSQDPAKELEEIKQKLESSRKLSGKEKQALRARKRELQEQLGQSANAPTAKEIPTPRKYKVRISGQTGKEAATDVPSWIDGWPDARPGIDENGTTFATRMMNKRYGEGGWEKVGQHNTEFSQLKKFGDRAFE
jgi:Domain of unknown function (DUF4157)